MRARVLSVLVAGAFLILGPVPAASAAPADAGTTNLGDCDFDLDRPSILDRDREDQYEDNDSEDLLGELLSRLYDPESDDDGYQGLDNPSRDLLGNLLGDDEDRDEDFDTNNLLVDGFLSLLCEGDDDEDED